MPVRSERGLLGSMVRPPRDCPDADLIACQYLQ